MKRAVNKIVPQVTIPIDEKTVIEAVAANCAWFRQERGLSLEALARLSGVSKGMLVEIEQRRTNPSIATLCRMANALRIGLAELLYHESPAARISRHARGSGKEIWHSAAGSRALLVEAVRVQNVGGEMWRWSLAPGEHFDGSAHPDGTHEFLYVLRGALLVEVGGESAKCAAQESVGFRADASHRYSNPGEVSCEFVMWVAEPIAKEAGAHR